MLLLLLSLLPSPAQAVDSLCGVLGSQVVMPHCDPSHACPHWRRLQYDLRLNDGRVVEINVKQPDLFQSFSDDLGKAVCTVGEIQADGTFLVDSIKLAP